MKIVTYEQRVAKMVNPGDEDKQLQLAKDYVIHLRRKLRAAPSLDEKLEIKAALKEAKTVLRRLRLDIFELEDTIRQRHTASGGATLHGKAPEEERPND